MVPVLGITHIIETHYDIQVVLVYKGVRIPPMSDLVSFTNRNRA